MTALRLLCFNIHGGRSRDKKRDLSRIHDLLERHRIDVAVFQEMETRASYGGRHDDAALLAGTTWTHQLCGPSMLEDQGWYGNLLISRYPITRGVVHNLDTAKHLEPRGAVDALIDSPIGCIRIVGTHLSLSPMARWTEVRNLLRLIDAAEAEKKCPMILMGDMNEWRPTSNLLRHLNRVMTPIPCGRTFPSSFPTLKLDRAWHDDISLRVHAETINGPEERLLSDHLPVLLVVER